MRNVVRLSFAVRPPGEVLATVAAMPRPPVDGVLWSPRLEDLDVITLP